VTAELSSLHISERLQGQGGGGSHGGGGEGGGGAGWNVMMKDLILKTLKEQRFDDVRVAEGMEGLKQELKTRLNAILPKDEEGNAAVKRILFDEYITQ
jgi:hypothetical protein